MSETPVTDRGFAFGPSSGLETTSLKSGPGAPNTASRPAVCNHTEWRAHTELWSTQ
jgi:hypothetical protein